ncbi:universal stress protein [Streptomyces sp. NRRL WC-3626]|uniref:universal stress protein n=1 Tax=Streptomyces sp. NRRL WC-3626 TaxID=1463926 RepID=UPI0004BEABE7|nr:universal stress protein [Streptomyces sp. NRRL WC-3626]
MDLPLVVGVDGSDPSLAALDWAVDEAARHGLPLRLVHSSLWERYEGRAPSFARERPAGTVLAQHIVASAAERARLRRPEVKATGDLIPEDPVSALLSAGQEARLLVVGSRGRGELAALTLGSVGLAVAARAVCPVVVVRGGERNREGAYGRVVVGVGNLPHCLGAVRFAFHEARVRGAALHAVRAWRRPASEDVAPRTADDGMSAHQERASANLDEALLQAVRERPDVDVIRAPVEGPPHQVLLEASADADLIVVGALRRHGHPGLQLGRVAHTLLHHAPCPVAVVPQRV